MPQALPAAAAWIMGSTAGAVVARIAITVAVGLLQANAQKRKMKRALANMGLDSGRSQMIRDPLAPRRIIYGEVLAGGVVTFYYQKPGSEGYHYMVVTLASHPVEAITQIRFNNLPFQNADGSDVTSSVVRIRKFLGNPEGERDLEWENEIPNYWGPQHLGKSIARLHIRLKWDENTWPNGLPEVSAVVKGAKVYDPRDPAQSPTNPASWKWNNNAALVAAHFLHTRKNVPYRRIVEAPLIAAANLCSEQVPLKTGGTEPRYRANGLYTYDQNPLDVLSELEDTMAGSIIDAAGHWTIHAGAWRAPIIELTDADLVSEFRCTPRASRADTYNGVRGTFFNPKNEWAASDFPAVKNDTYMHWDGGTRLWKDTAYPYITSSAQAQRVAKIDLERARQQLAIEADFNARALRAQPGDIIQLTRPRLGWDKKPFEIRTWELKVAPSENAAAGDSGMALTVGITAVETAPQVYDWNDGDETTLDLAPNTGLIPQNYVAPPANFKLSHPADAEVTELPRIKATWNQSADPLVVNGGKTELQFRQDSESTWTHWSRINGSHTHDFVNDLLPYKKVHIRARHENINSVKSDWASASITPESVDPYLELSHYAIGRRSQGGFYSEHLIIKSKTKSGAPYPGRYWVRLHVATNPDVYHIHFFSPHNQTQHHFALNNNWGTVLHIEVSLYKSDTPNEQGHTAIETKLVPVIKDGQDGLPGPPGVPGGGGSGQQYSLMLFRSLWIVANGHNTIDAILGGGSKPAGQNAPLTAPSSVFYAGFTYNFYKWAASEPAGSWIANPNSPNTTIAMHGNATVYANYHSYQALPPGW